MDVPTRRAWAWHRQGLDGTLTGAEPAIVVDRAGWARTVGGSNAYATLWSRAGTSRAAAEAAVSDLRVHELPSARGCTYLLPAPDYALGLQLAAPAAEAQVRVLDKLGVGRAELDLLGAEVLEQLSAGPLDPAGLRNALGEKVRSLGEAGRKRGASTALPTVLGRLQATGSIRRIPVGGRLDQQRYSYSRWDLPGTGLSDAQARVVLLRRYFGWTGGATVAESRWFTAFSVRDTKAALAELDLVDVGDGLLVPAGLEQEARSHEVPAAPSYRLVSGIDSLILLRRNPNDLLDARDAARVVPGDRQSLALATDLPDHPILDRGRIVGLWQYDPDAGRIVWWAFDRADEALRAEIDRTETWIRDDLGDFRSFSLDSPASRQSRLAALRAAG